MVKVIINSDIKININDYESIYNLKELIQKETNIEIDNQILYYKFHILKDNKTLKHYDIKNNSVLLLKQQLKGGFDTLSILMWLIYLCALLFYLLILISGLIPIIAHTYGYLLHWALTKLGNMIGFANNRYYHAIVFAIMFIVSIAIVYYFVYASTAFISFPLMYAKYDTICKSILVSNRIGFWVAIFFIIVYALFNIPNFILNIAGDLSDVNFILAAILQPILGVLENFANVGKFAGIYAIPFVGTPFLEGYHFAVSLASTAIVEGDEMTKLFSCDNEEEKRELGLTLLNASRVPPLKDWIKSEDSKKIIEIIIIGLIPELYNNYKCQTENLPIWDRFGETGSKFYFAKYATKGFCFALKFMQAVSGVLDYIGGSTQIANMIKTGNIGGIMAFVVFIICLILSFFNLM